MRRFSTKSSRKNQTRSHKKLYSLLTIALGLVGVVGLGLFAASHASAAVRYPSDLIGGANQWKLTIPDGAKEFKPIGKYSSKFFFLNKEKDGIIFRVWHGGGTTSGSKNPRSELREKYGGDWEGYWSFKGTHILEIVTQVNRLTKVKPHVVLAQIHDKNDDLTVFRLEGKQLWITNGDNPHGKLVDGNFKLGRKVKLKIVMVNGVVTYYYNDKKVNYSLRGSGTGYFKAGNYLQSNPKTAKGEKNSEYSEVELFCAKTAHNKALPGGGCDLTPTTTPGTTAQRTDCQIRGRVWSSNACQVACVAGAGTLAPTGSRYHTCSKVIDTIPVAECGARDRKTIQAYLQTVCVKRWDTKTVYGAPQCADPKSGYARFTYIRDNSGDYCGYW